MCVHIYIEMYVYIYIYIYSGTVVGESIVQSPHTACTLRVCDERFVRIVLARGPCYGQFSN